MSLLQCRECHVGSIIDGGAENCGLWWLREEKEGAVVEEVIATGSVTGGAATARKGKKVVVHAIKRRRNCHWGG